MTAIIHFVSSRDLWPNKSVATNRRPASPFEAEQQFGSVLCASRVLSAAVAHLCRWRQLYASQ